MNRKTTNIILIGMLAGVVLGGLLGYVWPEGLIATKFIGVLFLNALKVIIIPLIVASMIVGVTAMGDIRKVGRVGVKVIVYFLATTTIAVAIGLILVNLFNPGEGVSSAGAALSEGMAGAQDRSITDIFEALIPSNLIAAMAEGKFLGIIIFSLVFGGVLTTLGPKAKTIISFFQELNQVVMKMVFLILFAAPIGLFSVVGTIVAENSDSVAQLGQSLFWYGLTLIIGLTIHGFIVLPLILKFFSGRSPLQYAANMLPAFATAVGTSSSSATLPVTYECVVDKNKVDPRAGQFVLPLGTTVNMDGTAMYVVIATIFIAQVYNVPLGFLDMFMIGFTAVLVSIGAAGIPSAALFMLAIVFGVAGFPEEAYAGVGLILAVDWFLDRCRTTINVWGDSVGAAVIAESFEFKTASSRSISTSSGRYQRTSSRGQTGTRTQSGSRSTSGTRTSGSTRTERGQRGQRTTRTATGSRTTSGTRTTSGARASRGGQTRRISSDRVESEAGRKTPSTGKEVETAEKTSSQAAPVESRRESSSPFEITEASGPIFDRESGSLTNAGGLEPAPKASRPSRERSSFSGRGRDRSVANRSNSSSTSRTGSRSESDTRKVTGRVSPDSAARDLVKLSAQLGRGNKETSESITSAGSAVSGESSSQPPKPTESTPRQAPTPPPAPPERAPEPASTDPATSSESSSFGRTRTRKGMPLAKPETTPSVKKPEEEASKSEFDSAGISFGRTRRKRTR